MHYGLPFLDQSGRKWHNKSKSGQKERGKLSRGRQEQRTGETRSKSELEETPVGDVVLIWTVLSGRGNWLGACVDMTCVCLYHHNTQKDRLENTCVHT